MFINKLHYYLQLSLRARKTKQTHIRDMGIEVFQRRKRKRGADSSSQLYIIQFEDIKTARSMFNPL